MKAIKSILIITFFLCICNTIQAQLFEKLKQKSENKTVSKTATKLQNTYNFDWEMAMKIDVKKNGINMYYLIKQDAGYFGTKMDYDNSSRSKSNGMLTIMDSKNNVIITLMDMEGNKVKRVKNMPNDFDDDNQNFTITETDTKTILGYNCQGYKITTTEGIINIYIATNAPVSFNKGFSSAIPKSFNPKMFKKIKEGLLLEMTFKSNKKKKNNVRMICTSLKKNEISVNTNDYKSFGF